jgi:hypothetical protein
MNSKNNETAEMNFLKQLTARTLGGRNTNKGTRQITNLAYNISDC